MLGNVYQDDHGISILYFCNHKNILLEHGGETRDRKKSLNTSFWDVVIQNSLGTTYYDPTTPKIYIWDSVLEVISTACNT